jgi:hypothetical protein
MFIRIPPSNDREKTSQSKPDDDIYVGITPDFARESGGDGWESDE